MNGKDILVLIDGDVVGSQRGVTFEETQAEIDVSSKDQREMEVIAGRYSATFNFDALYVPTDNGYERIKASVRNGSLVTVIRQEEGAILESAAALITSVSEAGPDQDAATIAVAGRISGPWVAGS